MFNAAIVSFMINFVCDLLATWGLYYLLRPVNRSLSLLTAWMRLVYTAIGIAALFNLLTVRALLITPEYQRLFLADQLHGQVKLAIAQFDHQFGFSSSGERIVRASLAPLLAIDNGS
jgi:hypothetical protein